ncbi:MAG: DUF3291 domain-containing protein [Alphaproteobacteria bacterium]
MADRHLAPINKGRLRHPADHPAVAEFMDNLDLIKGPAERAPGFVWRPQDDPGNARCRDAGAFRDGVVTGSKPPTGWPICGPMGTHWRFSAGPI